MFDKIKKMYSADNIDLSVKTAMGYTGLSRTLCEKLVCSFNRLGHDILDFNKYGFLYELCDVHAIEILSLFTKSGFIILNNPCPSFVSHHIDKIVKYINKVVTLPNSCFVIDLYYYHDKFKDINFDNTVLTIYKDMYKYYSSPIIIKGKPSILDITNISVDQSITCNYCETLRINDMLMCDGELRINSNELWVSKYMLSNGMYDGVQLPSCLKKCSWNRIKH